MSRRIGKRPRDSRDDDEWRQGFRDHERTKFPSEFSPPDEPRGLTIEELRAQREELFSKEFGYSNTDNPFGDSKLSEPFLWKKKLELGVADNVKAEEYLKHTKDKMSEIDMVKRRRQEREREERLHEDYKATMARERDAESYEQWRRIEDEFFKTITQMRTIIRIKERREDVFDVLLKILEMSRMVKFSDMRIPSEDPDGYLMLQTDEKLQETAEHIRVRLRIEKKEILRISMEDGDAAQSTRQELETNIAYWSSLQVIVKFILMDREKGKTRDTFKENQAKKRMSSKSLKELEEAERTVLANLDNPDETQDIHFNEMLKTRFPYFKAIACVKEVYNKAKEQSVENPHIMSDSGNDRDGSIKPQTWSDEEDGFLSPRNYDEAESPKKWPAIAHLEVRECDDYEERTEWRYDLEEQDALLDSRSQNLTEETEDADLFFERFVQREKELKQEDELVLEGQEVEIRQGNDPNVLHLRKPRYFNRVKTGFEWNRYNQTHYDQETPPPKVVQGYKFTISYPNLWDKSQTPTWKILPSETPNDGTVILKFTSGPPYEDLAFRIANREWDCNPKRGFRNRFDQSILQLHFNFKRLRYRK